MLNGPSSSPMIIGNIFARARTRRKKTIPPPPTMRMFWLAAAVLGALAPCAAARFVDTANSVPRANFSGRGKAAAGCRGANCARSQVLQLMLTKRAQHGQYESFQTSVDRGSCSTDPREQMTTIEIIRSAGYPAEEHFVTTEDGYILALHRIPGKKGSPVVFLQHALLESSFCWVVNGQEKSLAYILSKNGYDVWMGNARGNTYSRRHVNLSTSDPQFWNFSWHEMGVHDLPAAINYVSAVTNDKMSYIAHSMGTTVFYVMASERPKVASKVKAMISLAPVAFIYHIKGPFRIFGSILQRAQEHFHFNGLNELLSHNSNFEFIGKCICTRPILKDICSNILFTIYGFNRKNFDLSTLPLILTHTPAGTSFKTILHFIQGYSTNSFGHYDYGAKKNLQLYNSEKSPDYNLSAIQVPIALFWGQNDLLAPQKDVQNLFDRLTNVIGSFKMEDPQFNHLDFVWGINAARDVYSKVLRILEKYHHTDAI